MSDVDKVSKYLYPEGGEEQTVDFEKERKRLSVD